MFSFSDMLSINSTSNITFFISVEKKYGQFFSLYNKDNLNYEFYQPITSETFSLLKFPNQDIDYSLDCLAGNLTPTSEYITIFPVRCTSKIANAYFCNCLYLECHNDTYEQLDVLVDPVFEQDLSSGILSKTNQVMKMIDSLDRTKTFKNVFQTMWYSGLPCFDLKNITADKEGDRSILKYCECFSS